VSCVRFGESSRQIRTSRGVRVTRTVLLAKIAATGVGVLSRPISAHGFTPRSMIVTVESLTTASVRPSFESDIPIVRRRSITGPGDGGAPIAEP